jgi:hypothetical protein
VSALNLPAVVGIAVEEIVNFLQQALDFGVAALEPVRRPDAVNPPALVFENPRWTPENRPLIDSPKPATMSAVTETSY